eukprot:CAMPEP_0179478226 /NCGR_PEP_ID=MMETSP0799-20121207/56791_1 /TAXON_ID=46947 /ORGANISM="Geminigera cryophila, Strain CCMP2564" /LENGTH=71 /DNA_ID=CAMNT_0021289295 /DNA_START=198 /DNA_END=410 /DNA_ORIENTATION=+
MAPRFSHAAAAVLRHAATIPQWTGSTRMPSAAQTVVCVPPSSKGAEVGRDDAARSPITPSHVRLWATTAAN